MPPSIHSIPVNIYTVVAAIGAVATSVLAAPGIPGWLGAALGLIMLVIAAIDARWFLIPDSLNAAAFALGLVHAVAIGEGDWHPLAEAVLRAAVIGLVFLAIRVIYRHLRGREGIGLGDVKLATVAGCWLGWLALPIAIEIAALSALAVYGFRHYALRRSIRAATRLPFGMFFSPAIWTGWLLEAIALRVW